MIPQVFYSTLLTNCSETRITSNLPPFCRVMRRARSNHTIYTTLPSFATYHPTDCFFRSVPKYRIHLTYSILFSILFFCHPDESNQTFIRHDDTVLLSERMHPEHKPTVAFVIKIQPKILTASLVTNQQELFVLHLPLHYFHIIFPTHACVLNQCHHNPPPTSTYSPKGQALLVRCSRRPVDQKSAFHRSGFRLKLSRAYFGKQKSVRHCSTRPPVTSREEQPPSCSS